MRFALSLTAALLLLCGCQTARNVQPAQSQAALQRFEFLQPHMATMFRIVLYAPDDPTATRASAAAFQRVAELGRMMSDYDPKSELMQLRQHHFGKPVRVSRDLFDVLQKAQRISEQSAGAFDITVGSMVKLWRSARKSRTLPSSASVGEARHSVGYKNLRLNASARTVTLQKPDMQLDLGGIAKGYAADAALAVLRQQGIRSALVAASGDIAVSDPPPGKQGWRVSIAGPSDENEAIETLLLQNAAVSTSGDVEQYVEIGGIRYSHIVDPKTGVGLTNRIQATVIAPNATTTDAVATALCVMGADRALNLVDSRAELSAIILKPMGKTWQPVESKRFGKFRVRK